MISPEKLEALAHDYIDECLNNYKEHPTASGKLVLIKDRHIPTIDFFLRIWIPNKNKETICRSTYYNWLNGSNIYKAETIKNARQEGHGHDHKTLKSSHLVEFFGPKTCNQSQSTQ